MTCLTSIMLPRTTLFRLKQQTPNMGNSRHYWLSRFAAILLIGAAIELGLMLVIGQLMITGVGVLVAVSLLLVWGLELIHRNRLEIGS